MGKDKLISFKIEEEAKEDFEKWCKENHTTPSHELRLFVHQKNKLLNSKRISLNDYANKRRSQ